MIRKLIGLQTDHAALKQRATHLPVDGPFVKENSIKLESFTNVAHGIRKKKWCTHDELDSSTYA
jgi:hypothetical protein